MNPVQAWQAVLGQLQIEMPRASFDTWVRDTHAVSLEEDVLIVGTCNPSARDWLESRLTSTIQRLLIGILNREVTVQFVVEDKEIEEPESEDEEDERDVEIEPVQWLDYESIVQPHKQVVVKGYLRRLGMEIGPKAIWLYIGFHQAAWMVKDSEEKSGMVLHSGDILRFSGLSFGAFWRSLRQPIIQNNLMGLVQRLDAPDARRYRRGRDGRPHRIPIRYQVFMTPRLTHSDANALDRRVREFLDQGATIEDALRQCLSVQDALELLHNPENIEAGSSFNTVMDITRAVTGVELSRELDRLAQELHRKIVNALGDIHLTHYFITQVIHEFGLTPAQAWLVAVTRDMAYLNWRTGERREVVTFRGGYQEMAALIGSQRFKTVQAWFNPAWLTHQRGGDICHFMQELESIEMQGYPDLRVESMPRRFQVLLDEPLDANGSISVGANGSNSQTRLELLAGANGTNMAGANGTVKSTLKHPLNTQRENTPTTQHAEEADVPAHWELKRLLSQNNVHPKVLRELLEAQASVQAFVSWVLYTASSEGKWISDPLGYAISRLREDHIRGAGHAFDQLAALSPKDLKKLMDLSIANPLGISGCLNHPYVSTWQEAMGSNHPSLKTVHTILFGKGGHE